MPAKEPALRKFGDNVRSRREAQDLSSSSTLSLSNGQEQLAERANQSSRFSADKSRIVIHHGLCTTFPLFPTITFLPYFSILSYFLGVVTMNTESAYMTSKGQVVIPARLRRKYGLKEGTKLNFAEEEGRFIIQPVTKEYISSFRGIFKLKSGEKSVVQEHLEDRAKERARERRELESDRNK